MWVDADKETDKEIKRMGERGEEGGMGKTQDGWTKERRERGEREGGRKEASEARRPEGARRDGDGGKQRDWCATIRVGTQSLTD